MSDRLTELVDAATRRPRLTLLLASLLAIGCGVLALFSGASTSIGTLVSSSSPAYRSTTLDYREFGGDAVDVLVRERLTDLLQTRDLVTLSKLEACLSGQQLSTTERQGALLPLPASVARPYGGSSSPCAKLMRERPAKVVYGPATFLNRAVLAVNRAIAGLARSIRGRVVSAEDAARRLAAARHLSAAQAAAAARAAGQLAAQRQVEALAGFALAAGITSAPSITNASFIHAIVFGAGASSDSPKARFQYLFPSRDSALIQVRLRSGLSAGAQARAIGWIERAVRMPIFRLDVAGPAASHPASYLVSGEPVVLDQLAGEVTGSIAELLIGAVLVMGIVLLLVFGGRRRLLPLLLALGASAITFGLSSLAGAPLTMASVAVLPILIGLAVDYAIQFQSRTREAEAAQAARGLERSAATPVLAVRRAGAAGAPTIAAAALATGTGFLVLLLSPVPMVRGFGLLLVVGVAVAFLCTMTAGAAALSLPSGSLRRHGARMPVALAASLRGARELVGDAARAIAAPLRARRRGLGPGPSTRAARPRGRRGGLGAGLTALARRPERVLAAGLLLAALGWIADTRTPVQSDITKLVPASMPSLRRLETLERVTGTSGEIDVLVHARDVAAPATVAWMIGYENELLSHFGYSRSGSCVTATLCPALSLPDLFSPTGGLPGSGSSPALSGRAIDSLLSAVPPYFSRSVITPGRRYATLSFGIRLMPLTRQQRVVEYMQARLDPPRGVSASLAGLTVLASEANGVLSSSARRLLTVLAGLLAVGLVLLAVLHRPRRVLVPLVPIVLATGWSALVVYLIGIPLNPMSATLGALVIAISTEFSVLLSERVRQERARGEELTGALVRAYRSTGAAVIASGITAICGFGVLVVSNITMLRDFGFVTLIDLSVSLIGVLLVLPAVIAAAEPGALRLPGGPFRPRRVGLRRRTAPAA